MLTLSPAKRAHIVRRELNKLYPDTLRTPLNYTQPHELLVAVILSAQCTDKKVNEVTKKLFKKYRSIKALATALPGELERDIYQTGFYRSKAKNLIGAATLLRTQFNGVLPRTIPEMLLLPGVGRKTANVVLGHLYQVVDGIAVDTHVRRLAKKFGLTINSDPNKIEKDLMKLFPKKEWWEVSYQLKAYGREYSPARRGDDDPISLRLAAANSR
jgi:endonuclease-3